MLEIEKRVIRYWSRRMKDFSAVREQELQNELSKSWLLEIKKYLPEGKKLKVLDVGTGVGFFAVLLAGEGHEVCGIDLTPDMIARAKELSAQYRVTVDYEVMDAMELSYPDENFDLVISRNLTWTLPDAKKAYKEWHRVLKKDGILLNFDADYAKTVDLTPTKVTDAKTPYGHQGMTQELEEENAYITRQMEISRWERPDWDKEALKEAGFSKVKTDETVGSRILKEKDLPEAPMFLVWAQK